MQTAPLGQSELHSTRLIYGVMRIHNTFNPTEITLQHRREATHALEAAIDAGYNHFDHADIYAAGECERTFAELLKANPSLRDRIIITTKCGIRWAGDPAPNAPHRYDFSPEHITYSCEQSLQRLEIDTIDLYLLHRPDVLMRPDEIAATFDQLHAQGKVRHFGVSNFTTEQLALLQSRLDQPLLCNQLELHPLRLDPFEDGTLDQLHHNRITPTSWSPVAGGRLFHTPDPTNTHLANLTAALDHEANALGVSRAVVLYAWLLKHPSGILPIVGTRNPDRIREAAAADTLDLSREAWYRIYLAARGKALP